MNTPLPSSAPAPASAVLATRLRALEAHYREVAATRMQGVPVLHAGLQVQAVGFAPQADDAGVAVGVLITPWFMNLLRLPLQAAASGQGGWLAVGATATRDIGALRFDAIGAHEPGLGAFEASSLFSPMFEFVDQGAAVATAFEVLKLVRAPAGAAAQPAVPDAVRQPATAPVATTGSTGMEPAGTGPAAVAPVVAADVPARRGFLFGRSAAGAR